MSARTDKLKQLLARVQLEWTPPKPAPELGMLECLLLCILTRRLTPTQSDQTLRSLQSTWPDWNELRVSQVQEFAPCIKSKSADVRLATARDLKTGLQEVYQKNHGFDLEHLREDYGSAAKFLADMPYLGASAAHFLLGFGHTEAPVVSTGVVRVLDRLQFMKRTTSVKKAREALSKFVPDARRMDVAVRLGLVVERWCDSAKPSCWECPLVEGCAHGKKVHRDWKVRQERLAKQREREAERQLKVDQRDRKRAEVEAKKRAREMERRRREQERKQKAAALEAAKKKAAADAKKREAAEKKRNATAAKKAAAKKAAAKKAAAKKAVVKKAEAKKKAASKKKPARKSAKKAPAKKKPAAKAKPAAKKKPTRKQPPSKKKPAAKKKPATSRKTSKKTTRKPAAKKKSTKRPAAGKRAPKRRR